MAISRDNGTNRGSNKGVQDRLLDAAEELFCEHGFEGTSIRDLAAAASCNIASVNYYFGGKDKLYQQVWRRHLLGMRDTRLASIERVMSQSAGEPCLEELLRSFAYAFVGPLVDEDGGQRLIRLITREMIDRHLPEDMFLEELIVPTMTALQGALVKTCPGLEKSKAQLVILSVVGQLIQALHTKAMFEHTDNPELPKFDLTELVNHVVKFSAAGIRAYAEGKPE
jgi:AcrR family transcriptional regulator